MLIGGIYLEEKIRIHNIVERTTVLGPGKRTAIWFQGCMRNCPGCMSQSSRPMNGGRVTTVKKVYDAIVKLEDIEGVTISGGEPFLQIDALYSLIKNIKKNSKLSVVVYTGYTVAELRALENYKINQLLETMIDILIDGEYVDALNDGVALRGSSNQTVHFLTARYKDFEELYNTKQRNAEIYVSSGELFFVGVPEKSMLETWLNTTNVLKNEKRNVSEN